MIVATAFSHTPTFLDEGVPGPFSNFELGRFWLDWCAELGETHEYELVICAPEATFPESAKTWRKLTFLRDRENVRGWPQGPNSSLRQLAWYLHYRKDHEPWLFIEPDCIPLREGWLAALQSEYASCSKPFMGVRVPGGVTPAGVPWPEHMSGNAIYPPNALDLAPSLVNERRSHLAWDIRSAAEVLPKMAATNLICHYHRGPEILSLEDLRKIASPEAVLYHSDKFNAIVRLLRARRGRLPDPIRIEEPAPAPQWVEAASVQEEYSLERLCELVIANIRTDADKLRFMARLYLRGFRRPGPGPHRRKRSPKNALAATE